MATDIALTDVLAVVIIDFRAAFDYTHDKAADLATLLYEEVVAQAPYLADRLYKVDGGTHEKGVSEVSQTLMTMAAKLMMSNRKSYRAAVGDAHDAIVYAVEHARIVEGRKKPPAAAA